MLCQAKSLALAPRQIDKTRVTYKNTLGLPVVPELKITYAGVEAVNVSTESMG